MKAMWNDTVLAESEDTILVEGNHYFPPDSINEKYIQENDNRYECPWKGTAHYFHVEANGKTNEDAAWSYPQPKDAAKNIAGYLAFWHGVEVTE